MDEFEELRSKALKFAARIKALGRRTQEVLARQDALDQRFNTEGDTPELRALQAQIDRDADEVEAELRACRP